jgi:3-dehydroquinate synthase
VTDENVETLHGERLRAILEKSGVRTITKVISPGESSKSLGAASELYEAFHDAAMTRIDPIFALGGGVVGDLTGFAASTYMRGLPLIHVPTTLLAQVDSAIGGKTAVNLDAGKNMVGTFLQARAVFADTSTLSTLPEREWRSGLAEVVKYAAIGSEDLFCALETQDPVTFIDEIVYECVSQKARLVEIDEYDTGERMILNYGHTFAHAIEKKYDYSRFNHGEAVAMGLGMAARCAGAMGIGSLDFRWRLEALLDKLHLNFDLDFSAGDLVEYMTSDKKNRSGKIRLILLENVSRPVTLDVDASQLKETLEEIYE